MKLYQQLEQTFKLRINSNSEIIPYIKKLSEMGKFDEPKKIAAIAILLDRMGKLEDEAIVEESLKNDTIAELAKEETNKNIETAIKDNPLLTDEYRKELEKTQEETTTPETPVDEKTVSAFTPENITDPVTPDSTTSS